MVKYIADRKEGDPIEIKAEFPLADLIAVLDNPEHKDFKEQVLVYFTKQKLMDGGASAVGDLDGKVVAAQEKWNDLIAGKWTGERTNATGASENKKIANAAKEASQVISLEGLVMKKTLFERLNQGSWTDADQAKLEEQIQAAASAMGN